MLIGSKDMLLEVILKKKKYFDFIFFYFILICIQGYNQLNGYSFTFYQSNKVVNLS